MRRRAVLNDLMFIIYGCHDVMILHVGALWCTYTPPCVNTQVTTADASRFVIFSFLNSTTLCSILVYSVILLRP